jgi:hypothetical protein
MTAMRHSKGITMLSLWIGLGGCTSDAPSHENAEDTKSQSQGPDTTVSAESSEPVDYEIAVNPDILPNGNVRLSLTTNIPGVIEVMAGLSLHGQAPDDVWIGKSERVRLTAGTGAVTFSTADLPPGRYDAEVNFYPRWGFMDARSRDSGISDGLGASSMLDLGGSGPSASDVQFKENGQRWVMQRVSMGDPWRPNEWIQRFGAYEELAVDRGNPEILKAYYFPRIDTTLIVNTLKGEISVWRLGRAQH